jgi:hypothetical protein
MSVFEQCCGAEIISFGSDSGSTELQIFDLFRIRIHFFRIRIQRWRLEANTDPGPIRIQGFNDQKLKKITADKKNLIFF